MSDVAAVIPLLVSLLRERQRLDQALREIEGDRDEVSQRILNIVMGAQDVTGQTFIDLPDGFRLRVVQQAPRKTLRPELLLRQGVTLEQIEQATVTGEPGKPFLRVDRVKSSE